MRVLPILLRLFDTGGAFTVKGYYMKLAVGIISAAYVASISYVYVATQNHINQVEKQFQLKESSLIESANKQQQEKTDFIKFVSTAMALAAPKSSEAKNAYLGSQIVRVGMEAFDNQEERETWVAILANESRFNPKAKSPVGAIGIGQVMPKSAKWYAERCNLPNDFSDEDLYLTEINLTISACAFKEMLKNVNNSKILALISYNAGQFSKDLKRIEQMANINQETANYVAKITRFLEKVREKPIKLEPKTPINSMGK